MHRRATGKTRGEGMVGFEEGVGVRKGVGDLPFESGDLRRGYHYIGCK